MLRTDAFGRSGSATLRRCWRRSEGAQRISGSADQRSVLRAENRCTRKHKAALEDLLLRARKGDKYGVASLHKRDLQTLQLKPASGACQHHMAHWKRAMTAFGMPWMVYIHRWRANNRVSSRKTSVQHMCRRVHAIMQTYVHDAPGKSLIQNTFQARRRTCWQKWMRYAWQDTRKPY